MIIDGLVALVGGVRDYFASIDCNAKVDFGVKARYRVLNQGPGGANRVVFIPGKIDPTATTPKALDAGQFTQPRHDRDNPRPLVQWHKLVSVSIWGVDSSSKEALQDPLAQYAATVDLIEKTYQALHLAVFTAPDGTKLPCGLADLSMIQGVWVAPPIEQSFGLEFLATFTQRGPLFDRVRETTTATPAIIPQFGLTP